LLGFLTLLIGSSGVFLELRDTLNYIWDAPPRPSSGIGELVRDRIFSFALVLGLGLLLTLSLAFSAIVQAAGAWSGRFLAIPAPILEVINFLITFIITSFLFALIYRVIPEVRVEWSDVVIGAIITAALFTGGKFLIGLYLGKAGVGSAYGAAGSLVILLVWVYYSAQIFIYGAEFTHVWARRRRGDTRVHK
jgi:membrane protein